MVRLAAPFRPLFPYLKPVYSFGTGIVAPFSVLASRARGGHLPRGSVRTLEEAAHVGGGRCQTVRTQELALRPVPVFGHPIFDAHSAEGIDRVAVAELPGGRVLGPHGVVVTRTGHVVEEVSLYFGTRRARQHPMFLRPFPPEPVDVPGRVAVLDYKGGAANYYHFVTDVLPRIAMVERCPDLEPPDLWYVPASSPDRRALLDLMGITADRRIDSTSVPHLRAETLVVPGVPGDEQHPRWVTEFLRGRLLQEAFERIPGRRLYLTRGSSKNNRTIRNEADVMAALVARGFLPLDPSTLTMEDEIRTFAGADVVVSAHGAGLTNIVFMSPGSTLVEVFPGRNVIPCYWKLANTLPDVSYRYLAGVGSRIASNRQKMLVKDITVDVDSLLTILDEEL